MKKLLLGLGSIAAIAAPAAAVVACGSEDEAKAVVVKTNDSEQLDFIHALVGSNATAKDVTSITVTVSGEAEKSMDLTVTFKLKADLPERKDIPAMKAGSNTIELNAYTDASGNPVTHALVNNKEETDKDILTTIEAAIKPFEHDATDALKAAAKAASAKAVSAPKNWTTPAQAEVTAFNAELHLADADVSGVKVAATAIASPYKETLSVKFTLTSAVEKDGDIPAFVNGENILEVISPTPHLEDRKVTLNGKALTAAEITFVANAMDKSFDTEVKVAEGSADAAIQAKLDAYTKTINDLKSLSEPDKTAAITNLNNAGSEADTIAIILKAVKDDALAQINGKSGITLKGTSATTVTVTDATTKINGFATAKEVTDYIATLDIK